MRPTGRGKSCIRDKQVMDLPEPDSPTRPRDSPRCSEKLTPSTAFTTPARVNRYVRRSSTSSSGCSAASPDLLPMMLHLSHKILNPASQIVFGFVLEVLTGAGDVEIVIVHPERSNNRLGQDL